MKLLATMILSAVGLSTMAQQADGKFFDKNGLVKNGAELKLVSDQFAFTEGPAVAKNGDVYFTDQPNNAIWKYDTRGNLSLFLESAGRANGLFFKGDKLWACADEKGELWEIDIKTKKVNAKMTSAAGQRYNGPNDLWIDASGGVYFTDPFYKRDYWNHSAPEKEGQHLYYLPNGSTVPVVVDNMIVKPNGVVGTQDGKLLYLADIGDKKIYRYTVEANGVLSNRTFFAENTTDGMMVDEKGNLYLAGKGVTVFNPEGEEIAHIPVPAGWTANLCFGGKDRNTLFITAVKSVFMLEMNVKGVF